MTTLVRQHDSMGCQIAVTAMLLDCSYAEAKALYPLYNNGGQGYFILDTLLAEQGYAVARLWRHDGLRKCPRDPWPPQPWADVHWCQVINQYGGHAVIMLRDGTVLDPALDEPQRLRDYVEVNHVTAVYRVA
jgi:hypothetical protein